MRIPRPLATLNAIVMISGILAPCVLAKRKALRDASSSSGW